MLDKLDREIKRLIKENEELRKEIAIKEGQLNHIRTKMQNAWGPAESLEESRNLVDSINRRFKRGYE